MLPDLFVQNIKGAFGKKGEEWLLSLPEAIKAAEHRWGLYHLKAFSNLSYNYVLFGEKYEVEAGSVLPIVLKIGIPCDELYREIKALEHYSGEGAVEVLEAIPEEGIFLLKQLQPGVTLKSYFPENDVKSIEIACHVIKKLHAIPCDKNEKLFPTIQTWHRFLYLSHDDLPIELLEKAREIFNVLIESQSKKPVLLHADLHHDNILQAGEEWKAIDPKGVMGEPEYEVGAFIRNPIPDLMKQTNAQEIIARRLSLFAKELGYDRERLKKWSFVQAVLSACWSDEEVNRQAARSMLDCAKLILNG